MSTPLNIADALSSLHNRISYKNAKTTREERMSIMDAAATAMGQADQHQTELAYLVSLMPEHVKFFVWQSESRYGCDLLVQTYDDEGNPTRHGSWIGFGDSFPTAIEDGIRAVLKEAMRLPPPEPKPDGE